MQEEGAPERGLEGLIDEALDSKEPIKKPQTEQIRPQGLLERIILSKWTAPVFAAAVGAVNYTTPRSPPVSITENLAASAVIAGFSYATAKLIRQDWLVRKAEAVRRKARPLPFKLLNILSEHPEIIAGGVSAYFTANLVSPMFPSITLSDLFQHLAAVPIAARLSAFLFPTSFVMAYPVVSLSLGRVFHPETFKTAYQATAAAINAVRGEYKDAAENLAKLLESQRSYSKAVKLQTLIGDLQLLSENLSCFDTYTNALATEKTSYGGRSDWVLKSFISFLKDSVVKKAKMPQWAGSGDLSYLIAAAHAFSEGKIEAADTLLASAVSRERHSLIAHQARAALMRRTGRHSTADLEMVVTGELLMREKDPDFEEIEGSRSRVLRKGRVVLKLNEEKAPLEAGSKFTKPFREEFGTEIIYPMPIYRLGPDYVLQSEMDIPETLLDLMKQRRARHEDFAQAMNLGIRVGKFGYDLYKAKKLSLDERILHIDLLKPETWYFANRRLQAIQQAERFNGIIFPESYKDSVTNDLLFVDRGLAYYPHLTMSKDHNPGNVLKRLFGLMQLLDFEPRSLRVMPPQIDLVALMEFAPYLTPQHIRWLLRKGIADFEDVNGIKLDRDLFLLTYEDAGLQWHFERLIYRPGEAAAAKSDAVREVKMKQQVRHYLASRRHLDTIIEEQHVRAKELEGALRAREALEHPIFADRAEYDRLCRIVEREEQGLLMREPLPTSKTRLALASAGATTILAASVIGAVVVRNNLIPFLNVPVFLQGDKVLLTVSETGVNGRLQEGPGKVKYFVIDAQHDTVSFLTDADNAASADLSAFQDKAIFVKDRKITLYDFLNREFRSVTDKRFENPAISPDGLWIASNLEMEFINPVMTELWRIRPSNMHTKQITDFPNAFLPRYSADKSWSPDGSYLVFLSNNEKVEGRSYPDSFKVWINTLELSSGTVYQGPFASNRGRGIFAWSPNGSLAYLAERQGEEQRIYLSDKKLESTKEIYFSNGTNMRKIAFIGAGHLVIETSKQLLLLNIATLEMTTLKDAVGGLQDVSKSGNRFLYECNTPSDVCEFDLQTGKSVNLTNTPGQRELSAVYAPNQKKLYVISYHAVNCLEESCTPSLFVLDLATGKPKLLRHDSDGSLRYSLIAR